MITGTPPMRRSLGAPEDPHNCPHNVAWKRSQTPNMSAVVQIMAHAPRAEGCYAASDNDWLSEYSLSYDPPREHPSQP